MCKAGKHQRSDLFVGCATGELVCISLSDPNPDTVLARHQFPLTYGNITKATPRQIARLTLFGAMLDAIHLGIIRFVSLVYGRRNDPVVALVATDEGIAYAVDLSRRLDDQAILFREEVSGHRIWSIAGRYTDESELKLVIAIAASDSTVHLRGLNLRSKEATALEEVVLDDWPREIRCVSFPDGAYSLVAVTESGSVEDVLHKRRLIKTNHVYRSFALSSAEHAIVALGGDGGTIELFQDGKQRWIHTVDDRVREVSFIVTR